MARGRALMSAVIRYILGIGMFLLMLGTSASTQGMAGPNVVVVLRLAGDKAADPLIQSCLAAKLSQMPDIQSGTLSTAEIRFVIDIVTEKLAVANISASLVVVETFPMEEFRPRLVKGQDRDALLNSMRFYTLLRLHELVTGRSYQALCAKIAKKIGNTVLATEYTERND